MDNDEINEASSLYKVSSDNSDIEASYNPDKKGILEKMETSGKDLEHEDHVKLQEEWMKSVQDERDNELIEKLISRLEEKGYLVLPKETLPQLSEGERYVETGRETPIGFPHIISQASGTSEPTPPYVEKMYEMPSDDLNISRMTESQYAEFRTMREDKIKTELEEFDKSDWQFFKEAMVKDWKRVNGWWKKWINKRKV